MRGCAASASIFGTFPKHESHGRPRIQVLPSTIKRVGDGGTGGNNFVRARSVLSWRRNPCNTFSSGHVLSSSGQNKEHCHVIPGTKRGVEQRATQTLSPRNQIHRTRRSIDKNIIYFSSHTCVSRRIVQMPCQQYLGTLRECFHLVWEWAREREWSIGRKTTAFVVSFDTGERHPLTSSLHFLQSSETAHPIEAGSTVTRLVHGKSVGCRLEHFCSCRVIEIPELFLRSLCLESEQELVDPSKQALVHEDRPIDPCLSGHSSFGSCDYDRPKREK